MESCQIIDGFALESVKILKLYVAPEDILLKNFDFNPLILIFFILTLTAFIRTVSSAL